MKKTYSAPKIYIELFAPNEYVAACGDSGKIYNFKCDAQAGTLYYYPNGRGKYAQKLGNYHPCSVTHEASSDDPFYDGFVDYNRNRREDSGEAVIVWRGPRHNNGHATKNLDMDSWETAKS